MGQLLTVGFRYAESMELIFEIRDAEEGGFYARALGHGIFTQGETWDELRGNVLEAVSLHFDDATTRPRLVQMHYVKDELIPLEAA
jgi:predicted RNase H-like HicB family nuclease